MHVVSWTYPEHGNKEARMRAFRFMHTFASVIPCMRCRMDWSHYLSENFNTVDTPHLESRDAFTKFLVDGHNYVNRKLNKREFTYEEARQLYDPNAFDPPDRSLRADAMIVGTFFILIVCVIVLRFWLRYENCPAPMSSGREGPGCAECAKNSEICAGHQHPSAYPISQALRH